jgi:Protein of unknown function (DUF2934)
MTTSLHTDTRLSRTPTPGKRASKPRAPKATGAPAASSVVADNLTPPPPDLRTRRELIAEAAYFRAEQRAFSPGGELADWLAAEAEVEARSSGG